MRKLRVLVLMHAHLVPPESLSGLSEKELFQFEMEIAVLKTLKELGHEVVGVGVEEELRPIREHISSFKPHVAFNILNYFHDATPYDSYVVSYLELLKQPYTGCNPRGIVLAGDKALSKKILSYHRIPCPLFGLIPQGSRRQKLPARMKYPAIVKSSVEHGSIGIAQASIVHSDAELRERVEFVHRSVGTDAVVEEYIEGREVTVSILGNERLVVFPVWELWFENLSKGGTATIAPKTLPRPLPLPPSRGSDGTVVQSPRRVALGNLPGMGEKPAMRSGPCFLIVCTIEAEMISSAVLQSVRLKPPLPRACCQRFRASGFSTTLFQASPGSA